MSIQPRELIATVIRKLGGAECRQPTDVQDLPPPLGDSDDEVSYITVKYLQKSDSKFVC